MTYLICGNSEFSIHYDLIETMITKYMRFVQHNDHFFSYKFLQIETCMIDKYICLTNN